MSSLIVEVCRVEKSEKHPNADKLSIITVKGWNCIVGLNQYKENDLVVFCPPDCIIPPNIIEKYNLEYLKHDGRTGSIKLRGYLSQGLILDLPEGKYKEGDDVSKVLGIAKWQPPEPKYSVRAGNQVSKKKLNPFFDKYTDIENIKNYKQIFNNNDQIVITEKIHGANSRFANLPIVIDKKQPFFELIKNLYQKYILKKSYQFVYGSHNVQLNGGKSQKSYYGEDVWGKIAERYNLANIIPEDYIIYGEVFGEGIQDLTYGLKGIDLVVFDMKYKGNYIAWDAVKWNCNEWELKTVPEIYQGQYTDDILDKYTSGKSLICPNQMREGIVIKMQIETNHPAIGRKILKSVSADYLTRKGGTEYQ